MPASSAPRRQGALLGTVAVAFGEGISLPAAVVTAAVLTRTLGPEAYGRFSVAAMLVTTLEWILIAIFAQVIVKFVAEAVDWRPVAATAFRAYLFSGLAAGATLWLLAGWIADLLSDPSLEDHLRLFAVEIPIFAAAIACRNVLAGTGRYQQQALVSAARWIGRMTLIVLFVSIGWAVPGAILGSIGGVLAAWLIGQAFVGRALWGRSNFPTRRLVRLALPAFLLMLTVRTFDQFGLLLLNALLGSGPHVGYYSAAQNVSMVTGIVAATVTPILISTVSAARRDGKDAHARAVAADALRAAVGILPFAGIIAGSSREVVELLFGSEFIPAASLLSWLAFVAVALINISVGIALLIARGKLWPAVVLTVPLLPLSLLGHLFLIPRLGALGAAIVTTCTAAVAATLSVLIALITWRVRPPVGTLLRSIALAGAAYAAASAWATPGWLLIVEAAVLSLGILVGFVLLGEFSRSEITQIRNLVASVFERGTRFGGPE